MQYLRGLNLITSGPGWWMAPLVFAAIDIVLAFVGAIPVLGAVAAIPGFVMFVVLAGWAAAAQRAAFHGHPGLPAPFRGDYFVDGFRVIIVGGLWMAPVGIGFAVSFACGLIPHEVGAVLFLLGSGFFALIALLWIPLPSLAMTRTGLARDWSGLDLKSIFVTFRHTALESYLGIAIWFVMGIALSLLGLLACLVGAYFVQPFLFAATSIFWMDVTRLAATRGAPAVHVPAPPFPAGGYSPGFAPGHPHPGYSQPGYPQESYPQSTSGPRPHSW